MDPAVHNALDVPFRGTGSFADYAVVITTVLALAVLAIVVASGFWERRRHRPGPSSLVFLGMCVLPVFMMLFGAFATVEKSKEVAFCHSCHRPMDMYVRDMLDPSSTTLAAAHYSQRWIQQQECYRCHADYGVWGSAEAKMRGFSHLYHWMVSSPTARGEKQIHVYGSYKNDICLSCHAGAKSFLESGRGVHVTIADNLLATDPATGAPITSCLVCHGPAHPPLAKPAPAGGVAPPEARAGAALRAVDAADAARSNDAARADDAAQAASGG